MSLARPLLARLYRDLAELQENPYPGVQVFNDDANLRKLCLVLTPPSGPWKDLSLHFDVHLPESWPASPPEIQVSVHGIELPNLFGSYICCDLLKKEVYRTNGYTGGYSPALTLRGLFLQFLTFFSSNKVEQDYGGLIYIGDQVVVEYARENDLQSLFTAICSGFESTNSYSSGAPYNLEQAWKSDRRPEIVLSSYETSKGLVMHKTKGIQPSVTRVHRMEYQNPKWARTLQLISRFRCSRCPYGSDSLPHHEVTQLDPMDVDEQSPLFNPPATCLLEILNNDIFYTLASHLPSEPLISFSQAYPRFRAIIESSHELLRRELTCFLRTSLQDSVLGICIHNEVQSRTLSSDFDWLSEAAFETHHIRKSIQKRSFEYFLPLAFSPAHFERVQPIIWARLVELDRGITTSLTDLSKRTGRSYNRRVKQTHQTVDVVYQMMNNIVVALMKSCEDALGSTRKRDEDTLLHASEKAVYSYCHLFHLLICLFRSNPNVLRGAMSRVGDFSRNPTQRDKNHVPDLGEFIVIVTLVLALSSSTNPALHWGTLNGPFLQEALICPLGLESGSGTRGDGRGQKRLSARHYFLPFEDESAPYHVPDHFPLYVRGKVRLGRYQTRRQLRFRGQRVPRTHGGGDQGHLQGADLA